MEKTIKWEGAEAAQMQTIDNERTQVLAKIGALMMDLETVKKDLDTVNSKQRSAIQQAIQTRGITQFESARPIQGGLVIQIPETMNGGGNVPM